jgi:hypothetical protein
MGKIKMDLMTNMKVNEILMFKVLNSFYISFVGYGNDKELMTG